MPKTPRNDNVFPLRTSDGVNDNARPGRKARPGKGHGTAAPALASRPAPLPVVLSNLPDRLPVLHAETDLILAYLPDLLSQIIANDNDPEEGPTP